MDVIVSVKNSLHPYPYDNSNRLLVMKKILCIAIIALSASFASAQNSIVGETLKFADLNVEKWISEVPKVKGKFIIVDFWATWCGPCRNSIPHMNKLQQDYKDNVVAIALSNESADKVKAFKNPVITYYSAVDTKGRLITRAGVRGIPTLMLIAPSGKVLWLGHPQQLSYDVLDKYISENK